MKIIVKVKGISPDNSWKYQDFTYSCIEYNDTFRNMYSEGQWYTATTPDSISTYFAFTSPLITPDIKEKLLALLKEKLNAEFANQMPTISDLKSATSKIGSCLCPSLKNLCFGYFAINDGGTKRLPNVPKDVADDFEIFRQTFRSNERW